MNEFLIRIFRWLNPWLKWWEDEPVELEDLDEEDD